MGIKEGQCFTCFDHSTFQYHGLDHMYDSEINRYVGDIEEGLIINCATCSRIVEYNRENDKWKMNIL